VYGWPTDVDRWEFLVDRWLLGVLAAGDDSQRRVNIVHIQPGKPTQNVHVESFNGRLREECLNVSWFWNLFDARRKIACWREEYNHRRPHSALNYRTPEEFRG